MKCTMKKPLLLIAMLAIILSISGCGSKTKINLQECIQVEPYGADGYGQVRDWMDEEMLLALIQTEETDDESLVAALEKLDLLTQIEYELDKTEKLSNGDKITVTVSYPDTLEEALGAKLRPKSGGSWTVEVSGLEKVHTFDIFQDIDVTFHGFDGYGKIDIQVNGGTPIGYTLSQEDRLSNGDVVTVILTDPNGGDLLNYCLKGGFMVEYESKEFTVSGLEEAPVIDLFENIDITVEGCSPYLRLSVSGKYEDDGIGYELDETVRNGELSVDDTVTIHAYGKNGWIDRVDLAQQCLDKLNGLPVAETYTYTIPKHQEYYLMEQVQLTEDILAKAIAEARDHFDAEGKAEVLSIQDISYHGYYLQTIKDTYGYGDHSRLYILHQVEYTLDGRSGMAYNVVRFLNPYMDREGTFRAESTEVPYGWIWDTGVKDLYDFEQEFITSAKADYTVVTGK